MGDLSKNFNRSEFACKGENCCGHSAPVHPDLIEALQALRDRIGKPLSITSGFRCNRHNKAVGGAEQSFHTLGMAADVACSGRHQRPRQLAALAEGDPTCSARAASASIPPGSTWTCARTAKRGGENDEHEAENSVFAAPR